MKNSIRKRIFDDIVSFVFNLDSGIVVSANFSEPAEVTPYTLIADLLDPFNLQRLLIEIEPFFSIRIEDHEIFRTPVVNGLPGYCGYDEKPFVTKNFGELASLVARKI